MVLKTVIFLGDGMADEAVDALDGRTPLQAARTPAMDSIARRGVSGTLLTLPAGFPTSSEVANMSVLGCDLASEYGGRGPLEAAGRRIPLAPDDKAFRLNLVTIADGVLSDYSGGHVGQEDSERLIGVLNERFGSDTVSFHPGVSYRNILVLSGDGFCARVKTEKPDDNHGERVSDHLPAALDQQAEPTVDFLRRLIKEAPQTLEDSEVNRRLRRQGHAMANGVWPWSGGKAGSLRSLQDRYGLRGAVISAVDVINGLGRCLGMEVINVPGATGYVDTDYEGKARAAIEALREYDLVYVHIEAIDEVSHEQKLDLKIRAIEDFDARIVGAVLEAAGPDVQVVVLPDHPVPVALGKHTRTPVPVSVYRKELKPDAVARFDEFACLDGSLGAMRNGDLMRFLTSS